MLQTIKPLPTSPIKVVAPPAKSIIKVNFPATKKSSKKKSVNFPKEVSEVIGYGGEWSGSEASDDELPAKSPADKEVVYADDENLQRLTKTNTEFNMNNGNLLGDPTANIKRSFAALKLGAPQKDSAGKKQTLKISVMPFSGGPSKADTKSKIIPHEKKDDKSKNKGGIVLKSITSTDEVYSKSTTTTREDIFSKPTTSTRDEVDKSPEIDVKISKEKSLLEEISETLLSKRIVMNEAAEKEIKSEPLKNDVIKVEIKNNDKVTSAVISSSSDTTTSTTISKRSITRGNAILKDMEKPKIQVSKGSESDNGSDFDCGVTSDYYDVVETRNSYENIPDGLDNSKKISISVDGPEQKKTELAAPETLLKKKSHFFSNHTVSEMFLAHKPINDAIKKRGESYNLMDNSYVSSKITNDGLIVTKSHMLEEALDSTGSSFDSSSSDEELSNNRSESDSGINVKTSNGISVCVNSSNSSDYEDIQVTHEINKALSTKKSRELAGEPDGRSDPDGSSETSPAPALPQNPPPGIDARQSFLHSIAKPKVATKPVTVSVVKPFQKRNAEIIMQLQQVINKEKSNSSDNLDASSKSPKKTRAPEPPNGENDSEIMKCYKEEEYGDEEPIMSFKEIAQVKNKFAIKTNTVQLKEPRTYPSINPKFRSLNHLNKSHEAQEKLEKFENLQQQPSTPEPAPRHSLSLSQDSLILDMEKTKKKKFSIKKFLRMGSKTENGSKKDYSHYADIPTSPDNAHAAPQVKPRLIIIHPLDINNTGVEVVKDASSASPQPSSPASDNTQFVIHKPPPAPPVRADTTKLEITKPSRPPPPKNTELRTKIESEIELQNQQQKAKAPSPPSDNVYANLGEIRSSIAPRKPERTASMREREAKALELQRRQPVGFSTFDEQIDFPETKDDEPCKVEDSIVAKPILLAVADDSFTERKKKLVEIENISTRSKIELFESNAIKPVAASKSPTPKQTSTYFLNNDGLKSSVHKMNVTIDNYLKNKKLISASDTNLLNNSRSPTPPQIVASTSQEMPPPPHSANNRNYSIRNSGTNVSNIELRTNGNYEPMTVNGAGVKSGYRSSYPENVAYPSSSSSFGEFEFLLIMVRVI